MCPLLLTFAGGKAGGGGGGPSYIIQDTFTEASDTALGSHTPDTDTEGGGWNVFNGSISVIGADDNIQSQSQYDTAIADIDSGQTDIKTRVQMYMAGTRAGIMVRYDEGGAQPNVWTGLADPSSDTIYIYQGPRYALTERDSQAITGGIPTSSWVYMYFQVTSSDDFTLYWEDTDESCTYNSSAGNTFTLTGVFFNPYNPTPKTEIDDFTVEAA